MAVSDIKVEVCVFAFDLLYLDGQPLIQRELNVRREVGFFQHICQFQSLSLLSSCVPVCMLVQLVLMVSNVFSLFCSILLGHACAMLAQISLLIT